MKKLLILLMVLAFSACSTFNIQDPVHKLAVQYATGKFIESTPTYGRVATARRVISYAQRAKQLFDVERKSILLIEQELLERLNKERLSPADRTLAVALITSVADNIEKKIDVGVLNEDEKVTVNEILNAIITTAEWYDVSN